MSIWDFVQKPRDPAVALRDKPTVPSFRSLKSYILSISWLLFLLSTASSSNLLSLPQPLEQLGHFPSLGISSSSSWRPAARNQAGSWRGKSMVLVDFFRFTRTQWAEFRLYLTELIPTPGVPWVFQACSHCYSVSHPWAFPTLHTVFTL